MKDLQFHDDSWSNSISSIQLLYRTRCIVDQTVERERNTLQGQGHSPLPLFNSVLCTKKGHARLCYWVICKIRGEVGERFKGNVLFIELTFYRMYQHLQQISELFSILDILAIFILSLFSLHRCVCKLKYVLCKRIVFLPRFYFFNDILKNINLHKNGNSLLAIHTKFHQHQDQNLKII